MASVPVRRWALPTREDLGATSRWVIVLLAMAILFAVLRMFAATSLSLDIVTGAVVSALPLLTAASLMYVAPRERLVALAAFGFAVPPTMLLVRLIFVDTRVLYPPWVPAGQYLDIAEKVGPLTDAVSAVGWAFTLLAVLSLAFQVGMVRSRLGWFMVLIGAIVAVTNAVVVLQSWAPVLEFPGFTDEPGALTNIVFGILGQLVTVAWAYLAAVALDRRLVLLALATFAPVVLSAFSRFLFLALPGLLTGDLSVDAFRWTSVAFYVLEVGFDALLIAAILLELPRRRAPVLAPPSVALEAHSGLP